MKTITLFITLMLVSVMATASTGTARKYSEHERAVMLKNFDNIKEHLYEASVTTGINMAELTALGSLESKLRPKVKNGYGTAAGVLQYTDRTWKGKKKQYAEELGVKKSAHQYDARANLLIGGKDLSDSKKTLISKTHLTDETVRLGDVYMMHFLGEDGAQRVINSYSHKPLNQIVKIHPGNGRYYYKPNGQIRTAREFRQYMDSIAESELKVYEQAIAVYQVEQFFKPIGDAAKRLSPTYAVVHNLAVSMRI